MTGKLIRFGHLDWIRIGEQVGLASVAWVALAQNKGDEALALMRQAAEIEGRSEKSIVTPGRLLPARELLGDMLLEPKRPAEAFKEYEASQQRESNRYRGVYGRRGSIRLPFNPQLRVEFRGATVTSEAGLLLPRRLGLDALIERYLTDPRTGHNRQLPLADLFRQSIYSRLAGYEDTSDAERLAEDPTCRMLASRERRGPVSRSPRRSTGSRRRSSLRGGITKDWLASTRH